MIRWIYAAACVFGIAVTGMIIFPMIDEREYVLSPDPSHYSRASADAAEGYNLLLEFADGFRIPNQLMADLQDFDHSETPVREAEYRERATDWEYSPEPYWEALVPRFVILDNNGG
ncbi:MAG: hypothetical protein JJU00_09515 [Opitutales bacterium]|nr:hypothetical protein [Opitutales bacterium]